MCKLIAWQKLQEPQTQRMNSRKLRRRDLLKEKQPKL